MDNLEAILKVVNQFTPTGIIALMVMVVGLFLWKNPLKAATAPIEASLEQLKSNHLHDLPRLADSMEKVVEVLSRIELRMAEEFAFIRVKLENDDK